MNKSIQVSLLALAISAIGIGSSTSASAADSSIELTEKKLSPFSLSYVVSFPTVSTASFLSNAVSYRGVGFEWMSPIHSTPLYWGVSFRWLYFQHNEDQESITSNNTTVTGRIYRSVDSFPLALHLKYPFLTTSSGPFLPFIGLGVGTTYGRKELNVGAFSENKYGWQFLMAPEVGTEIEFSKHSQVNGFFNVRYDAGFGSDAIDAISNISLAIGITKSIN